MIIDFRREINGVFALLGCYAPYIGIYLPMFRDYLSVLSSKVFLYYWLDLWNGTDWLSRNVGN